MRPQISVTAEVGATAGHAVADALDATLRRRARVRLAVAGGSSPLPVFAWLATNLDPTVVARLDVTWVDERHGPPAPSWRDLPDEANLRGAWAHWFDHLAAPPAHLPMRHAGSLAQARDAYAAAFAARFDGAVDVVLLGTGADGHVGSLFPAHRALTLTAPCLAIDDSPKPPPQRLTLSLPVLQRAHTTVLVATGPSKASVLAQAASGRSDLPLALARPTTTWRWVLDPAAAALLPSEVIR